MNSGVAYIGPLYPTSNQATFSWKLISHRTENSKLRTPSDSPRMEKKIYVKYTTFRREKVEKIYFAG